MNCFLLLPVKIVNAFLVHYVNLYVILYCLCFLCLSMSYLSLQIFFFFFGYHIIWRQNTPIIRDVVERTCRHQMRSATVFFSLSLFKIRAALKGVSLRIMYWKFCSDQIPFRIVSFQSLLYSPKFQFNLTFLPTQTYYSFGSKICRRPQ